VGKNQQKTTFNDASGLLNSFEASNAGDVANLQNKTDTAAGVASQALQNAQGAYGGLDKSGISGILQPGTDAASGLSATGGYAQPQLNALEAQEQGNLGGLDPTALSKLSGQYQDLISSGGISDATQAAMQRQAVSGVSSLYGTLGRQQQRTQAVTGGQGGGGEIAQMARQLAQQEANAVTGVNAQVGQLRQQGTEAGLAGASGLQSAQAAAKDAAARTYSGTQAGVAGGVQTGAGLQSQLAQSALSGNLASAGGELGIAGLTAQQQQALQSLTLGTQQLGVEGENAFLKNMGSIANNMPPWYQSLIGATRAIGGIAGGLGGAITGAGSGLGGVLTGMGG
jgi:hypothetical protein